jgi:hypothetical protein
MNAFNKPRYLPDLDRLSIVAATMLLAYVLARFINFPVSSFSFQLPGLFLTFQINLRTFITLLIASLIAAGTDWLIRDHPALGRHYRPEHWLIPAFTALVIGIPLFQLPLGALWWGGFILGGTILMLVLVAEYIVVDADDVRQPIAAAGLTVVSFALFLILSASLRFASLRLYLILPALTLAAGLISLRTLHLRLHGKWAFMQAGIVALLIGQLVAAFHYWPLSPVAYALALLGAAYSLTNFMGSLLEGTPLRQALLEPLIILLIFWITAYWIH